ncbi:MAG: PD-(D/E)XK nuclease family protein [Solirubrobacteraceae bacterium]
MTATTPMHTPTLLTGSRHALERHLADEVLAQRVRDPLGRLPILVGGTLLRPYLRRRLAELVGAHMNVRLLTVGELGLQLGHRQLVAQGRRRPLPFLADRILAHQVALNSDGYFKPVAAMPGFPAVLLRTLRDLRLAGITATAFADVIAAQPDRTGKLAALAELYRDHERCRAGFFSSEDGLVVADPTALEADRLLIHGIWQPSALLLQALTALSARVQLTVLLPRDHDGIADSFVAWARDLGGEMQTLPEFDRPATRLSRLQSRMAGGTPADESVVVVSAPDPTREAGEAVRACVRWADTGIAFHEMAVVYRQSEPYRALLEAAFREAKIATYLHEGTPLTERPLGRRIAAMLDLVDGDLERPTVMAFLSDARLPHETWEHYGKVSPAGWDTLSRRAGIVRGAAQWDARLLAARAELEARHAEDPPAWLPERLQRIEGLRSFVADLNLRLRERHERASWQQHLAWLRELLTAYVADAGPVIDALDGLAALDTLSDELSFERFHEAVVAALEGLRAADILDARAGAYGVRGVAILDANTIRQLGFRAVAVVGIAERRFPPPPRQDALLLDEERIQLNTAGGWSIPLRTVGADPEPLQYATAIQAANDALQLSVPRTQDGDTRPVLPSTFLLDSAAILGGSQVRVADFEQFAAGFGRRVPSGRLAPGKPEEALTELGYLRAMLENGSALGVALLRRRTPRFDRVTGAEHAHWSARLGPHDGVLSSDAVELLSEHYVFGRPLSPSSLETYAACPQRFFLGKILGLKAIEEPAEVLRINPMDRGTVFHAIVEQFMRNVAERNPTAADWPALAAIADVELDRAQQQGLTGHPVLWAGDRRSIREDVERWLEHELDDEEGRPLVQADYEVRFGPSYHEGVDGPLTSDTPLTITLADGETLQIAGRIDRVQWRATPASFRVIDYKTGAARGKPNALDGGMALQLPLYLLAAAAALGVDPSAGEAQYFYATRKGEYKRVAFTGAELEARTEEFQRVLSELRNGVRGGDFHAEPSRQCDWCDFDSVCDARRKAIHTCKSDDPYAMRVAKRREEVI